MVPNGAADRQLPHHAVPPHMAARRLHTRHLIVPVGFVVLRERGACAASAQHAAGVAWRGGRGVEMGCMCVGWGQRMTLDVSNSAAQGVAVGVRSRQKCHGQSQHMPVVLLLLVSPPLLVLLLLSSCTCC